MTREISINEVTPGPSDISFGDEPDWTIQLAAKNVKARHTYSLRLNIAEAREMRDALTKYLRRVSS